MSLWSTPADPNFEFIPGLSNEDLKEILNQIDFDEIRRSVENDKEFQKRIDAFRTRPTLKDWFAPIY